MCQLYGSVTTLYQCCISAALLSVPVLKMFLQVSASAQNIGEFAFDTIACTVMSQKSMPLVSFHPYTDAIARRHQDCERTQVCRECFERTGKQVLTTRSAYFGTSSWPTSASTFASVGIFVPSSQHFRPPRYWASWCSASTWGGTT